MTDSHTRLANQNKTNPWDRRDWPESGDQDERVLFATYGMFISRWEEYENLLSRIFSVFVAHEKTVASMRAYHAVRTFEGRTAMLRAASEGYFSEYPSDELLDQFKTVRQEARGYSQRRNDLAHATRGGFQPHPPTVPLHGRAGGSAMYPSEANFKDRDVNGLPKFCYSSEEIYYFYTILDLAEIKAMALERALLDRHSKPRPNKFL